jgi:chromosome segregation ATPase
MSTLEDLAQRVEHLLVRHAELQRTQALLQQQVQDLSAERDALRQRLATARTRLDALIARVPPGAQTVAEEASPGGEG